MENPAVENGSQLADPWVLWGELENARCQLGLLSPSGRTAGLADRDGVYGVGATHVCFPYPALPISELPLVVASVEPEYA